MKSIVGLLLLGALSGCALPKSPNGWVAREAEQDDLDDDGPSRLQLLFCYGPVTSHCLVRIVGPNDERVLWDPGGIYGRRSSVVDRRADVVHGKVPSLEKYWSYRMTLRQRSDMMGVFEWDVPDDEARDLRTPLVYGHDPDAPERTFETDIVGLACGLALGDYIMRYTSPRLNVPVVWVLPKDTADWLWVNHPPDRVIMFDREADPLVYEPSRPLDQTAADRDDGRM